MPDVNAQSHDASRWGNSKMGRLSCLHHEWAAHRSASMAPPPPPPSPLHQVPPSPPTKSRDALRDHPSQRHTAISKFRVALMCQCCHVTHCINWLREHTHWCHQKYSSWFLLDAFFSHGTSGS